MVVGLRGVEVLVVVAALVAVLGITVVRFLV